MSENITKKKVPKNSAKATKTVKYDPTEGKIEELTPKVAAENILGTRNYTSGSVSTHNRSSRTQGTRAKTSMAGELNNIYAGVSPFNKDTDGVNVKEAIELSQKAYWNVAIYRMTIDIMTEFCNSCIHFRGGNASSRKFYDAWYKKLGGCKLGDQFFREWFRSGNVFFYRLDADIEMNDLKNLTNTIPTKRRVPIRYILLNPADIRCENAASFVNAEYSKLINSYEVSRLKNPQTEQEKEFFNSLPAETRKQIRDGNTTPSIKLSQNKLHAVFCKKQDYEALAIPIFFPVLFDINLKLEFKKAEQAIARTVDYIILLITMGNEPDKGGVNQNLLNAMTEIFRVESVGRVLVADYTTEAKFVIPELNKILGSEKYKVVNEDIANGMLNLFFGQDKFANSMVKIKIFLERLKEARKAFLECFLIPEMERIAKELGFKSIPYPEFEEVDLRDEVEYWKIYNRMYELGLLTPEETYEAFNTNKLPLPEDSLQSQKKLKEHRDNELYMPITAIQGGDELGNEVGRPDGTKQKQSTKKVSPVGASKHFSVVSLKENFDKADKIIAKVEDEYKNHFKIQRMSKKHKASAYKIAKHLMAWYPLNQISDSDIQKYVSGNIDTVLDSNFPSVVSEVSTEHNVEDEMTAILLANSICENPSVK